VSCVAVLFLAFAAPAQQVVVERELRTREGAVACVDREAARVGAGILAEGGNAVDAAIATAFALAVTYPAAGNLGGGGFMVLALADGRLATVDYRETAPARAWPGMFLDEHGEIDPEKSKFGHWVVGVPGTVAGLALAHREFGRLPWEDLLDPARHLAAEGFEVDADLAGSLARNAEDLGRHAETARCFLHPDGRPYAQGERLVQPDLANTLRWIQRGGPRAFYEGPIAALLDAEMRRHGGLLRAEDLASYRALLREPVSFRFRGFEVVAMAPPSSGGVTLGQILGLVEGFELGEEGVGSPRARHLFAEAGRRAFAERAHYLGDPEATDLDLSTLLSPGHLETLREGIDPGRAGSSEAVGPPLSGPAESTHTTHFSVVDREGNAVSNTYTIEDWYGSRVVAEGTGFLLNNELHDFNLKPGYTDRRGRIGTDPNLARPGRRPLSSMCPTVVRNDRGEPVLVTGSPGGRTIISTVAGILIAVLDGGMPLKTALELPRQHHQWYPDEVVVEESLPGDQVESLRAMGHSVRRVERIGDAHSIEIERPSGVIHAVADRRLDGWVAAPSGDESRDPAPRK
jgi:gamma-glutamyltranspeptidase/glutathione hydrolase